MLMKNEKAGDKEESYEALTSVFGGVEWQWVGHANTGMFYGCDRTIMQLKRRGKKQTKGAK